MPAESQRTRKGWGQKQQVRGLSGSGWPQVGNAGSCVSTGTLHTAWRVSAPATARPDTRQWQQYSGEEAIPGLPAPSAKEESSRTTRLFLLRVALERPHVSVSQRP